jgi:hypothetical protein
MAMLHPLFVADILEGFEGTHDEMAGRVESPELSAALVALRSQVAALRVECEETFRRTETARATPERDAWSSLAWPSRTLPTSRSRFP